MRWADRSGLSALGAFVQGLTEPSLLALVVACSVVAVLLTSACLLVRPSVLGPEGLRWFGTDRRDDYVFVTARLWELQRSTDKRPLIAIIGASSARESFASDTETAAALRSVAGADVEVALLASPAQLTWQARAIVEQLPADRPTIVLLSMGPIRLIAGHDRLEKLARDGEFGFRSLKLDEEARGAGIAPAPRIGVHALDNAPFYLNRLGALTINLVKGSAPTQKRGHYFVWRGRDGRFLEQAPQAVARFRANYETNAEEQLAVLRRLAEDVAARGWKLVLFESPLHPRFIDEYLGKAMMSAVRTRMMAFAQAQDLPYLALPEAARLGAEDYADINHLASAEAQQRMREALARSLTPILAELGAPRPTATAAGIRPPLQ